MTAGAPRVLFVSKPIVPPFHDGTKCLVRDVARHLGRYEPLVMSAAGAPPIARAAAGVVEAHAVYGDAGAFTPSLAANARAALWIAARARADLWHFVFAPNRRSSAVGRLLRRLRGVPVLQTIASPPRDFSGIERALFGDVVVAQSRWTATRAARAGVPIEVIPPPVDAVRERTPQERRAARRQLGIADAAPLFVYPGDLETSRGAERVALAVEPLARELPDAVVVLAYRAKTPAARGIAAGLERRLPPGHARLAGALPDLLALVASATAVLFPVDDLSGKVDLPIALLESLRLGVPVVVADTGPLAELEGAVRVPDGDGAALVRAALDLARDPERWRRAAEAGRAAVAARHDAAVVASAYEALYDRLLTSRPSRSRSRP